MSVFNTPINNILRNSKTKFGNYDDSGLCNYYFYYLNIYKFLILNFIALNSSK